MPAKSSSGLIWMLCAGSLAATRALKSFGASFTYSPVAQINHALFDAVGKGFADVGILIEQTGNAQNVALLILNLLFFLHRFQADNRTRHDDRANQADRQHHNQRAAEAVFIDFLAIAARLLR